MRQPHGWAWCLLVLPEMRHLGLLEAAWQSLGVGLICARCRPESARLIQAAAGRSHSASCVIDWQSKTQSCLAELSWAQSARCVDCCIPSSALCADRQTLSHAAAALQGTLDAQGRCCTGILDSFGVCNGYDSSGDILVSASMSATTSSLQVSFLAGALGIAAANISAYSA